MTTIGIIGAGYVGKNVGKYFLKKGFEVKFFDIDERTVSELNKAGIPATNKIEELSHYKYIFVSVPTPTTDSGEQVLDNIVHAINNLTSALSENEEHVIIVKSTLLPGTTEKVIAPVVYSRFSEERVGIIYNPEFLTEIHGSWANNEEYKVTPENEHRLVIGESANKKWGDMFLGELYQDIRVPVIRTDYKTAEMIKYASNNALAARISYWNEVFLVCRELGIDSNVVAHAASLDPRIGKYGTVHGKAFGGKCLPKDLKAFINFARRYREVPLHEAVEKVNEEMKEKFGVRE